MLFSLFSKHLISKNVDKAFIRSLHPILAGEIGLDKQISKEEFVDWLIHTSEYLNETHWNKIMQADSDTAWQDRPARARSMQGIAGKARNDINKFRTELGSFAVSDDLATAKTKCSTYLDNWDNFFYYMAKWSASKNVDDLGVATQHYKAVDVGLSEIKRVLGLEVLGDEKTDARQEQLQPRTEESRPAREKEIIREKEVVVKIRCTYCRGTYNETLDECPHCGAKR
jgi:hypothetical protein